ncbi:hybrid sensor histidine kinase/response regulator [Paraburkholderia atlantica]|uniref:hybrid sensor histidine kinase/response regulator n=1 Tax=Paraburkholderia atlantica TaxID=2654982 RepID=UPI00161D47DE|nr:PAS domain S-box protein [Paraburkholderia atlantica]MBB5510460.1 PAS domain S-box-containing protein [Paraburkholderia atlantica]
MEHARILIVEDDRIVARDIQQQLQRAGHTVVALTGRGEDALQLAIDTSPDLVLMDVRLEGEIDGIDVARQLRDRCHIPVVFLTAYADSETVKRAALAEPFGYILKPFEDLQLRTVVEMALYKHRAEARLRESEQRYAITLASIGDAVIATDRECRVTFINRVAETLTGWQRTDAMGQQLDNVFVALDEASGQPINGLAAHVLESRARSATVADTLLVSTNGRSTPIEASASPITGDRGNVEGVVVVFHDVSERRQAEEATLLRKVNARLDSAMRGSDIGVWEVDMPDGDFMAGRVHLTNIWERLGYGPAGDAMTPSSYFEILHPDDRLPTAVAVNDYLAGRAATFELENRVLRQDGIYRWMLVRGTALRNSQGEPVRFTGTVVDITELKRTEAELKEMMQSVRNVSNAIAHDLRTPLAELRSRLETLLVMRPASDEVFSEVDAALCDIDRVIAIFNALLRLAEIDAGIRQAGFIPGDVGNLVTDAYEFYLPVAELRGISLTVECQGDLHAVADHLLIAQAVGNLIDNALKYAPRAGTIRVAAMRNADGKIAISVSDSGPGIPDTEKDKVTGRFYRGDASRGTPGVGLGLSLVAAVATLHGGSVAFADNHPGTVATLLLTT